MEYVGWHYTDQENNKCLAKLPMINIFGIRGTFSCNVLDNVLETMNNDTGKIKAIPVRVLDKEDWDEVISVIDRIPENLFPVLRHYDDNGNLNFVHLFILGNLCIIFDKHF